MLQDDIKTKRCYHCKIKQPLENYNLNRTRKDGHSKHCRKCSREFTRKWLANMTLQQKLDYAVAQMKSRDKNKDKRKLWDKSSKGKHSYRKARLKRKYSLTVEDYNRMLLLQKGKCAICKKEFNGNLCIDHDHETGEIRGLLCKMCNTVLGFVDDNIGVLGAAILYLTKEQGNAIIKSG